MNTQKNLRTTGIIYVLISAVLYSVLPILIRILGKTGIPPMSQVFFRYTVAFFASALYFTLTKQQVTINKKTLFTFLGASIYGYALSNLFYTYSILNTHVGNALFLFFSFTILAPVLAFFILKDRLNRYNIVGLLLTLIALLCLFQPNAISTWKIGGLFALLAATGQALYLVLRRKLLDYKAPFLMLANTALGVVIVGVLSVSVESAFFTSGTILHLSAHAIITTVFSGLVNFAAWLTMTKGFEYIRAATGSIILLLELLMSVVLAFLFFQETPTILTLVGGMLIALASLIVIQKGAQ